MAILTEIVPTIASYLSVRMSLYIIISMCIVLYLGTYHLSSSRRKKRIVHGPPKLPILGNTLDLISNLHRMNDYLVELTKQYGRTFSLTLFGRPTTYVTSDPAVIEHVLKTNFHGYGKGPRFHSIFECLLGDGSNSALTKLLVSAYTHSIFNADGETWVHQRKIASHMFSVKKFTQHMDHVFQDHALQVAARLHECAQTGTTIDIQQLLLCYTLDSITAIAFGESMGSLHTDTPVAFAASFDRACKLLVSDRAPLPVWLWKVARFLGLFREKEIAACVAALDVFAEDIIGRRLQKVETGDNGDDLLSLFIKGGHTDVKYLRDVLFNFMIAGRDTTAIALSWTFHCLHLNPHVQAKAVAEIRAKLGDTPASYESVKQLTNLKAVFFETLRLYPSVPKNVRMAYHDDVLPGGVEVAKGDVILYAPYVMGRDALIWDHPLDFKPERWIDGKGKWSEKSTFDFPAFNAGPRLCLGKTMAVTEALVLLATILPLFDVIPTSDEPPKQVGETLTLPMHSHTVSINYRDNIRTNLHEE